ncbi:MAG: leucine-rich repeat domain-containing protein, partial [Clostridia bacterium]
MKKSKLLILIMSIVLSISAIGFGAFMTAYYEQSVNTGVRFEPAGLTSTFSLNIPPNTENNVSDLKIAVSGEILGARGNSLNDKLLTSANLGTVDSYGNVYKSLVGYSASQGSQPKSVVWNVGSLFFNNSDLTPIVFRINLTNYTPFNKVEFKITEVDAGGNPLAVSVLDSIATRVQNVGIANEPSISGENVSPSPIVSSTLTYTKKSINQGGSCATPLRLKVEIVNYIPAGTNRVVQIRKTNANEVVSLPFRYDVNTTPYLVTWYSNMDCTTEVPYDYTSPINQILYGKTGSKQLFVPSAVEIRTNLTSAVPSLTANLIEIYKIGGNKVWITHLNTGLTSYALPPKVVNGGVSYTVVGYASPFVNSTLYQCLPNEVLSNSSPIEFPITITEIGDYAFKGKTNLNAVVLPSNLTKIGYLSFAGCTNLDAGLTLPSGLTSIGGYGFSECTNLKLTSLPAGLTLISSAAFNLCANLKITSIPSGITTINNSSFSGCSGITNLTLPANLTTIQAYGFINCTNLNVGSTLPSGITLINEYAFYNCRNLTLTSLPSAITVINNYTFYNCVGLTNLTLNNNITSIGKGGFRGCTNLNIGNSLPSSLTSIGELAFLNCNTLKITSIPQGVTRIELKTFYNCTSMSTNAVELPANLTFIGDDAFTGSLHTVIITSANVATLGVNAFNGCVNIKIPNTKLLNYETATNWVTYYNAGIISEHGGPNQLVTARQAVANTAYTLTKTFNVGGTTYNLAWYAEPACTTQISYNYTSTTTKNIYGKTKNLYGEYTFVKRDSLTSVAPDVETSGL